MQNNNSTFLIFFLLLCLFPFLGRSQAITDPVLKSDIAAMNALRARMPEEKIYLAFDRPRYFTGDTIHFKAWVLNGDFLTPALQSGLLYVELDDAANTCVKRILTPLAAGISWGDIAIPEKDIPPGAYTLRAYTNAARNFGEDRIFKKSFFLAPAAENSLLVNTAFKTARLQDKDMLQAELRFTTTDKQPFSLKQMQLQLMSGKKMLAHQAIETGIDGNISCSFPLPEQTIAANDLFIVAMLVTGDTHPLIIPVNIWPEDNALLLSPEGGSLVAGIPTRVGFKANAEQISGTVFDSGQQPVARFTASHDGIGSFELTPLTGQTYTARVSLPAGGTKDYPLPAVKSRGTVLKLSSVTADSVELTLSLSPDLPATTYYLIAQARGVICYARALSAAQPVIKIKIARELFPAGIARFSLLGPGNQVLNERLAFLPGHEQVQLTAGPVNITGDSVTVALALKDASGKPLQGNFSLSTTDNPRFKADIVGSNIINYLLLCADIQEPPEDPGYFFTGDKAQKLHLLDEFLLTQKLAGYDWKMALDPKMPVVKYPAEPEFAVKGTVTNLLNKPVQGARIIIVSQTPFAIRDTVTDNNGQFVFRGLMPIDTAAFKLQATNKRGKEAAYGITMDEFKQPHFTRNPAPQAPWYVNADTALVNFYHQKIIQQNATEPYKSNGHLLKEVNINENKTVKDSKNPNGPGQADLVLDEQDMLKAGKTSLGDLLQKNIKGFKVNGVWRPCLTFDCKAVPTYYMVKEKLIRFIIDGISLDKLIDSTNGSPMGIERYTFIKSYLDDFTAEDITGIELLFNPKYTSNYGAQNAVDPKAPTESFGDSPYVYIEITTRSGQGPFNKSARGTYLYKPIPFSLPKPGYNFWVPNLVTASGGTMKASFLSTGQQADYIITVNGITNTGEPASLQKIITIMRK